MKNRFESVLLYLLPSIGAIIWVITFFGVLMSGPRMVNADGDLGRHITIGSYIIDHRLIPLRDIFSHTMTGEPLTPHEWLAQVLFALMHRALGINGAVLLAALVIATAFWLVYRQSRAHSASLLAAAFVSTLGLLAASIHWLSRPHIFTFLLLAMWMGVLYRIKNGDTHRWWLLPLLMLAWVNLHGAFIAGFVTWVLCGIGILWDAHFANAAQRETPPAGFWKSYLLGGGVSLLATLFNPKGPGIWGTSVGYVSNRYLVDHTVEYQSPNFHDPITWLLLLFIALLIVVLAFRKRHTTSFQLFPAVAWLVMALYSARNIPLFIIVSAPLLTAGLVDFLAGLELPEKLRHRVKKFDTGLLNVDMRLKGILLPVLSVLIVVIGFNAGMTFTQDGKPNAYDPAEFPVEAVNWLEQNPQPGETFNYFTWGGYLLYRQWPQRLVFIDGQTDFYGETLAREYQKFMNIEDGWESVLDDHYVDWVILPTKEHAARALEQQDDWQVVYRDDTAIIIRRK